MAGLVGEAPIRLLIVDDSTVARAVLTRMLSGHADLEVVATASSAQEALDALASVTVDTILLDIEMPGASGVEALPRIIAAGDGARVLIVSSLAEDGAAVTIQALAAGADDTLPKPQGGQFGGRFAVQLAERIRRLGRSARGNRAAMAIGAPLSPVALRDAHDWTPACVAIGASTGGIHALNAFFDGLEPELGAPILVTQHLPPSFMPHFARQLAAASGRPARVVADGERLDPDHIHVAPGTAHFCLARVGGVVRVRLDTSSAASGCLPSVDPMLTSVGAVYGRGAVAVVLSGMGRDGLVGSRALVDRGGVVLAQDERSSAIWGMPRAVAEAGLASAVLPPRDLARRISARAAVARAGTRRAGAGGWR